MKAAALVAMLLSSGPAVRFEADGVRVGDALVTGAALQLRDAAGVSVLASGSAVEPLAAALEIEAAPGLRLVLEPGVRAERKGDAVVLSTHGKRTIVLGELALESPVTLVPADGAWKAGETVLAAPVRARLQEQDPDANLESLRKAARKIQQTREARPEARERLERRTKPRSRRVFGEDPFVAAEAVDSQTLRFIIPLVSPAGF